VSDVKAPYLGKQKLWWCDDCCVPLVSKRCGCGADCRRIQLTPPADVRPAFEFDVKRVNALAQKQFGKTLLTNLALVNKLPYTDAAYEIVSEGAVLARMFFDGRWVLKPTVAGAAHLEGEKTVRVADEVFGFLKRGDLLGPGVDECTNDISAGDEVIVSSPGFLGAGTARMGSAEMSARKKGMAVKMRAIGARLEPTRQKRKNWEDAVAANAKAIDSNVAEAKKFIKRTIEKYNLPLTLAFSGGKDSLAALLLSKEFSPKIIFVNTGLEFPETVEQGERFADVVVDADDFYEHLSGFGPPARDFRWCCKVCKLGPTAKLIEEKYPNGCLTIGGERKYESFARSKRPRVDRNKWLPKQLSAYPILNWTALEVWLYIFSSGTEYNPLYEKGFDRIGCYLCPASDTADLELVRELHPELLDRFDDFLEDYANTHGLDDSFLKGRWRWSASSKRKGHDFRIVGGISPCKADSPRFEGRFNGSIDIERLKNLMTMVGGAKGSGFAKGGDLLVFPDGRFFIETADRTTALKKAKLLRALVLRANFCTGCGLCKARCPNGAMELKDGQITINDNCKGCLECLQHCPLEMD